ncbi:hypothetical protein AR457_32265 [Streptomyces agglomeratus]|uniref:Uncharacterized protein n=1 Tax=Streptomyces agglomeratus TaxID=285458 RepID=A0A1E5PFZ5_9ACTN|nr:hypothetical protein [Streptomyces agglomeratus]OEJ28452.1 hypothetical protein AS594_32170 [Streptomyces agglomeratus]OEJ37488.1 hypothetical protein BGK70_04385 [Streptomyces agglomeratus]OEJ48128.1 hypothetical protein AR457_32265 [Streptomyces agglomeratus]OEJ50029.1 hypothetical protein BGK72_03900 [Streptomyces agglomeratus]OEJ57357.1 hypothetical protein BGM19_04580 [Streptomyces agglomeratus]
MTIKNRLDALLEAGFTDRLGERDRGLLARRALLKSCHEEPSWYLPDSWWFAVPGESYEGLFTALDLHDRFPVTLGEGADVTRLPSRRGAVPVFVTPELDGWRLICGNLEDVVGLDWDEWMEAVERLSAHCGEAQMFCEDIAGGTNIWVVAEHGRIRRRYACDGDPEWTGEPLPWEELLPDAPYFDPDSGEAEPNEGTADVAEACGHLSVDPTRIGARTTVRGHGWLALSAPGVGHQDLRGVTGSGR